MSRLFFSLSTTSVKHDSANTIVEFITLNHFGKLSPFSWRKGQIAHEFWKLTLPLVKKILSYKKINVNSLSSYVYDNNISVLDNGILGNLVYNVQNLESYKDINEIIDLYKKKYYNDVKISIVSNNDRLSGKLRNLLNG